MAFYTGSSKDGSDARQCHGAYVSPDGKEWSNMPYPKTKQQRTHDEIMKHIVGKRNFLQEYDLIKTGQSELSRSHREYVIGFIESGQHLKPSDNNGYPGEYDYQGNSQFERRIVDGIQTEYYFNGNPNHKSKKIDEQWQGLYQDWYYVGTRNRVDVSNDNENHGAQIVFKYGS